MYSSAPQPLLPESHLSPLYPLQKSSQQLQRAHADSSHTHDESQPPASRRCLVLLPPSQLS